MSHPCLAEDDLRETFGRAGDVIAFSNGTAPVAEPIVPAARPSTLFRWSAEGPVAPTERDPDEPLVTDRPDFTEASTTVGLGTVQIEAGYTFVRDAQGGITFQEHSFPETLFRIGMLADWFELRIAWNYLFDESTGPGAARSRRHGADDLMLGAKLALTPQAGWLPEMALVPQMFVPTGADSFSNDEVLPGLNWLYSWQVCESLAVGGSTQINRVRDDTGHFHAEVAQSVTMGIALTEQLAGYVEYFGFYPHSAADPTAGAAHFLNGGFTLLVTNDLQLDIRAGVGLNRRAENFFTGAGLSARY